MKFSDQNLGDMKLERVRVEALDNVLGVPFDVLDKGHVRIIDYMGSDEAIVQAARVSYGKGTKSISDDRGLIRYLMRHRHSTPFEMCEIKLHVRVPMDHWRQWIRHRTASVNEYSTRYSEAIDDRQTTAVGGWRTQSSTNKQGSDDVLPNVLGAELCRLEAELHAHADKVYQYRLEKGVAREQARKDLPLSTYTEAYWKTNLHNLLHFLSLRLDKHAQLEIRSYAEAIRMLLAMWCPLTFEAFMDYRVEARTFSRMEMKLIACLVDGSDNAAADMRNLARDFGWLEESEKTPSKLKTNRERQEFEAKIAEIGWEKRIPWEIGG